MTILLVMWKNTPLKIIEINVLMKYLLGIERYKGGRGAPHHDTHTLTYAFMSDK